MTYNKKKLVNKRSMYIFILMEMGGYILLICAENFKQNIWLSQQKKNS